MVAHAQFDDDTGPAGRGDDGDSSPPPGPISEPFPGDDDTQAYPGPLGRVDERLPHPECATCFTVPGLGEGRYQIFEKVTTDDQAEILIPRRVPNPAPLREGEVRERYDEETGEDIWYIGDQGFIGPTDEEKWSDAAPLPTIELQRIQMDYQSEIMGVQGVHGFGISPTGFEVSLLPEYAHNESLLPADLDGVPLEVNLEEMVTLIGHETTRYRPVPTGAGITAWMQGTLGPHVVRNRDNIGSCCQLWSLTASHIVKPLDAPSPTPGTRAVYQPTVSSANTFGYVEHAFQMTPCDTVTDPVCLREDAPLNQSYREPDVAAIDHAPYGDYHPRPFNTPEGTDPIRNMQYRHDRHVRGPSGRILTPAQDDRHKVWGSVTPAGEAEKVYKVGRIIIFESDHKAYKLCCVNVVKVVVQDGDSGALVAYSGTGRKHVAGIVMARETGTNYAVYIRADSIQLAFQNAGKSFSHYWGTQENYREPSTKG